MRQWNFGKLRWLKPCSTKEKMKILNEHQIGQKIRRLAIQILEHNIEEEELVLVGINKNGLGFAQLLLEELYKISDKNFLLTQIKLNPAAPTESEILVQMPVSQLNGKSLILIDDVLNTGRTIFFAIKPLLEIITKKVEVAVLLERKHSFFPIKADYVGLSLATTLKEHIEVNILEGVEKAVFLR